MKESLPPFNLSEEQKSFEAEVHKLKTLEGFNNLSQRQQRIIMQSLYVQKRAERIVDESSRSAMTFPDPDSFLGIGISRPETLEWLHSVGEAPNPSIRPFKYSQDHIGQWYCHAAVANLESEKALSLQPGELPKDFFSTEYVRVGTYANLLSIIDTIGFPCVVIFSAASSAPEGWPQHTCVALGGDSSGEVIVWEKQDNGLPYQLSKMEDIFNYYNGNASESESRMLCGVRKLRTALAN